MRLIILAGMPGAGKEEFLQALSGLGVPFLRMGDLVREEYRRRGLEGGDISVGQFAQQERDIHGYGIWATRASARFGGRDHIVDGCRGMEEIRVFREAGDLSVVAIHSAPETRYERLQLRGRSDAPANREEFDERDQREMSWGLAELIALADEMLVNDSDLRSFHDSARALMGRLQG